MYRLGAANGLREIVAQAGDGPNLARPLVGNQAMRDKLTTLATSANALGRSNQMIADTGRDFTEAQRPDVRGWRYALDSLSGQMGKASGDQQAAIGAARTDLLDQLRSLGLFDRVHTAQQAIDRGQKAFDVGRKVLRGSDAALWPVDLSKNFGALPLEQQAPLRSGGAVRHRTALRAEPERSAGRARGLLANPSTVPTLLGGLRKDGP